MYLDRPPQTGELFLCSGYFWRKKICPAPYSTVIGLICNTASALGESARGDTPAFCAHALNKRSGIDRVLGVLINLTFIYKVIGWITRDATLTNSPDQRTVWGSTVGRARQLQSRTHWRLRRARLCRAGHTEGWAERRAKRAPWLPSRGS